jgi:hypothetical protein
MPLRCSHTANPISFKPTNTPAVWPACPRGSFRTEERTIETVGELSDSCPQLVAGCASMSLILVG